MKTRLLFRRAILAASYILVFLGTSMSTFAQCPTIPVPAPAAICDAAGFTFSDLDAFAVDGGNGIVWYDLATGGSPFNTNQLVDEGIYFADDNSGACGVRPSITIDFQVNPSGQNLDGIYCSNENATIQTYIDDVLMPNVPSGGSVVVYNDILLTSQALPTDMIPNGASNYFVVFVDSGGCRSQIEAGNTAVFPAPLDPTPADPQFFCSDTFPTVGSLDPGTTGVFNWYQNVDINGDPILPALALSTPLVDGSTYYVQVNDFFCDSNAVPVAVTINDPVDAGTPGTLEYCEGSVPTADFDLIDELGGIPELTGTWAGPTTITANPQGTTNITGLPPAVYVYTYTVPGTNACPDAMATVTITVYETFTSGTVSTASPAVFCEAVLPAAFDLSTLLDNEDPGGQWTQGTLSTDPVVISPIDLTGFTPGLYNFTYTQNLLPNPCPEESTTVQVEVLADPSAGNAVNQIFCENDLAANSPFDLFNALDGTQDNNAGVWTDALGATVTNPIDITVFTIAGSPYTFNYTIDNGTCSDVEAITITVLPAPESGTPVAVFPEFCENTAPASFDLFDLLENEDQTGTWYIGVDNTGATTPNPVDLSVLTDGLYNFTFDVDAIGTCDDVLVTVQVTINPLPDTGVATPAMFCENDLVANSPLDLFGQLVGNDPGGVWSDDNASGALTGSDVDLTLLTIGVYNFTYSITDANTCVNSSTVTITVEDAPESGVALAPVEICEENTAANSPFDLFTLLDGSQDLNGTWYDGIGTTGPVVVNPIDISAFLNGTFNYTYSVPPIGSCTDVDVTVQIIINPTPNTGVATPAVFCENDLAANSPFDLFGQLAGHSVGGTWSDDDTTGALTGSNVDLTALTVGSYNFSYNITTASGCINSSTVMITVEPAPESGTANPPVTFCIADITTGQTLDLFTQVTGEDPIGVWTDDSGSGALVANVLTLDGLTAGAYDFTFDVDAIGACDDVLVTVTVTVADTATPTAAVVQEFCDAATVADLVATGTAILWYDDATGGTALAGTTALVDAETYYATQTDATSGCESSVRFEVTANIYTSPNSGNPNAVALSACNTDNSVDITAGLDGTQDAGGVWQDTDGTGALTGSILDATGLAIGTYDFTYFVAATAPCVDAMTTITVTIDAPLNAGTDATLDVCSDEAQVDLFSLIGAADAGGTWLPLLASGTGVFDPAVDTANTYTYFLANACGNSSSSVVVSLTQAPDAGIDASFQICKVNIDASNQVLDLFAQLTGTPDATGAFTNDDSAPGFTGTTVDLDVLTLGTTYTFTYLVSATAPCTTNASSTVTVTVSDSAAPIVDIVNPVFCLANMPTVIDLASAVTGTNIVWYADATSTVALLNTEALVDGEDYYATQTTASACESEIRVQVNVTVQDLAAPTLISANLELCITDMPTVNDLTLNIAEYDTLLDNVLWYDADMSGTLVSSTTVLITGTSYYAVLVDPVTNCESTVRLEVSPDLLAGCGLLVFPDGFSPNDDGVNDTYDIDSLDVLYPNFNMEIYNRYGNIVYKGNANTPRFDGKSNQSRTLGSGELPVGVYYYIFNYNDGVNSPVQGSLYLSR